MGDVSEEDGLGPVQFCKGISSLLCLFVGLFVEERERARVFISWRWDIPSGQVCRLTFYMYIYPCVGNDCPHFASNKGEEGHIRFVQYPSGIESSNEESSGFPLGG